MEIKINGLFNITKTKSSYSTIVVQKKNIFLYFAYYSHLIFRHYSLQMLCCPHNTNECFVQAQSKNYADQYRFLRFYIERQVLNGYWWAVVAK